MTLVLIVSLCFTTCVVYADESIEYTWEEEPNDSYDTANELQNGVQVLGVVDVADLDLYTYKVEVKSEVQIMCVARHSSAILCAVDRWSGEILQAVHCDYYVDGYYVGAITSKSLPNNTYYAAVYDEWNDINVYSLFFEAVPVETLDTPIVSVETDNESGKPKVTWCRVEGADYYEVWRSVGDENNFTKYYTTTNCYMRNISAEVGTKYYYKVRAICERDSDYNSDFSEAHSGVCSLATPQNVKVNPVESSGKPKVTWSAVEGADEYIVYGWWVMPPREGKVSCLGTTTNTYYVHNEAKAGETWYYEVQAAYSKDESLNSHKSDMCYRTCDLAKPTNVKASTNASSGKPKVTWNAVENADKYNIYRSTSKNGTYSYMYTTTNTHYTNTSAVAGKTYYYKVEAVDASEPYANSALSDSCYITCDLPKLDVKITLSSNKPKITWDKMEGASKYEIYRKVGENGTYKKYYTTVYNSFTNTSAAKGTKYYYKVVAVCKASTYGNSAYSNVVSITSK